MFKNHLVYYQNIGNSIKKTLKKSKLSLKTIESDMRKCMKL